jgi:hypothetical protein
MRNRNNKDRKPNPRKMLLSSLFFFIILPLVLAYAIVLTINNSLFLSQIFPSGSSKDQPNKDKHFLDRVAKNLIFSENPLEFSTNKYFTNKYYDSYLLSSNTQTDCQYGSSTHKCDVRIYIELNIENINNRGNAYFEFAIKDPQDGKYYETNRNGFLVYDLYFTNETKDKLVFIGYLDGYIQYRSEDETKEIHFSPKVKFIIPINDSKKDEFIQHFKN